jgi:hypothetical protein
VADEDALDGIRVIRSDRGAHVVPDIDHKRQVLPGTLRVEIPPVEEVAGAPDSPSTHCVRAGRESFSTPRIEA